MKKKFFGFLTAILTLGVLGGTAFVAASDNIQKEDAAYAANITGGTILYLKPGNDWLSDSAKFSAYFFDSSNTSSWASGTKVLVPGATIYSFVAPQGTWTHTIFCRMNSSSTSNSWNNVWNQTANLEYDGSKNLFTITNPWNSITGTWSVMNMNTDMYLAGDVNGWNEKNDDYKLEKLQDGSYQIETIMSYNQGFKITNGTWDGALGKTVFSSDTVTLETNNDGNAIVKNEGTNIYLITYKDNKWTIELNNQVVDEFVDTYMHMIDITHNPEEKVDTGACRGDKGYYALAKKAFEGLTAAQKKLFATGGNYANAWARFNAWATANGEKIENDYSIVEMSNVAFLIQNNNLYVFIIIAIGAISLVVLFYAIKRKRQTI